MTYPLALARKKVEQKRLIEPELAQLLEDLLDEYEELVQRSLEQADISIHDDLHDQRAHYTREYRS